MKDTNRKTRQKAMLIMKLGSWRIRMDERNFVLTKRYKSTKGFGGEVFDTPRILETDPKYYESIMGCCKHILRYDKPNPSVTKDCKEIIEHFDRCTAMITEACAEFNDRVRPKKG